MVEKTNNTNTNKKHKTSSLTQDDISNLLQRYNATTVLTLLQEVAHCADSKIDWDALVKNTSTGISDAREYHMLWRHLAYHHSLLDSFQFAPHPLDDDSDLECEVETFPSVSGEASTEAAACVKVLIASGLLSDSSLPNSSIVEAPITINIPNGLSSRAPLENSEATCSMQGTNITVPVFVQKMPLPAATSTPAEVLDGNGPASGNFPPRRKRKPWSEAEDKELIAAVQKCGEGNWANILKGDFKGDRTASQLSQRWNIIRKRKGNLNLEPNSAGSQLSEARRAAHHAMSLALDMPAKNLTSTRPAVTNTASKSVLPTTTAEAAKVGSSSIQAQGCSQQGPIPTKPPPIGSLGPTAKSQVSSKKSSMQPTIGSDSVLRATAVAAGARIVSPSAAASFFKATQTKNVVHFKPTGGSSTKSSMPAGVSTHSETQTNVQYVSTGPKATQCSSSTAVTVAPTVSHPSSVKAASPIVQRTASAFPTSSNTSSEPTNSVSSGLPSELLVKQEIKRAEEIEVSESRSAPTEQLEGDGVCVSVNACIEQIQEDKAASADMEVEFEKQMTEIKSNSSSLDMMTAESNHKAVIERQAEARQNANNNEMRGSPVRNDNQSSPRVKSENEDTNEKQADLPSLVADGCNEKPEVLIKEESGNEIEEKVK
ncbi:uncharacterized protein LOC115981386 [Quercus lobata]|uniref:uncharacterized protein LOC115981386 n=1 Tax=Quercus lobata TaxID=97700 RepID=UPI001244EA55|nr:uncharacterized protein LOC115981386 [Quercus lobata]